MTKALMVGGMFKNIKTYVPTRKYSCIYYIYESIVLALRMHFILIYIFFSCSFWNPLVLPYLLYPAPLDLLVVQIVEYIVSLAQKCLLG